MRKLMLLLILLGTFAAVEAHQPFITGSNNLTEVRMPEISKAYYGELSGTSHIYVINESEPFALYVNILMPFTEVEPDDYMSFEITKGDETLFSVDGNSANWTTFFESFGRDTYYQGPEYRENATAGKYYIKVFNTENKGKYSLAIGEIEKFSAWDFIRAFFIAAYLDFWFFKE